MDINSFQDHCQQNPTLDDMLDKEFIEFCQTESNLVIDYRLGFHFIKAATSIFLSVSEVEASRRISISGRQDETPASILSRNQKMIDRFKLKYGVDFSKPENYIMTIDTDQNNPEQIVNQILLTIKS